MISHDFIISFFSAYHAHCCIKYRLSNPLIPYILLPKFPGALMHLYIITIYVNDNTDNNHNTSEHLYYLLHPSIV